MNRAQLQRLSRTRLRDARALLGAGQFAGAYYLAGYAVECALKSCVARQVRRFDFPDKTLANAAHTHDLEKLVKVAGLERDFSNERRLNPALDLNWVVVKDWTVTVRYDVQVPEALARELYSACTARTNGVIPWIRTRW
jgi:HEPN domain-containing protein